MEHENIHHGQPPQNATAPHKRHVRRTIVALIAGLAVVAILGTGAYLALRPQATPNASANRGAPVAAPTSPSPTPSATLSPDDFDLKVKILKKECFGSAGCNVTYQIQVAAYGGPDDLGDQRFRVVYEVRGGEDGPQVNNLIFEGDSYQYDQEETISTRSQPHLTAKVTDVIEEDATE